MEEIGRFCRWFDNWRTAKCRFPVQKLGNVDVNVFLDLCPNPARLDLITEISTKRTMSSFVVGNQLEWRQIGPNYWPLELNVHFQEEKREKSAVSITACLDTIRTGIRTCFIQLYNISGNCDHYGSTGITISSQTSITILSFLLSLIAILLLFLLVRLIRHHSLQKRPPTTFFDRDTLAISQSLPNLPITRPYSCRELPSAIEMDTNDQDLLLVRNGLRMSKIVQTCNVSLDTSGLGSTSLESARKSPRGQKIELNDLG